MYYFKFWKNSLFERYSDIRRCNCNIQVFLTIVASTLCLLIIFFLVKLITKGQRYSDLFYSAFKIFRYR